ncbi:MAG: hypothetical protein K6A63_00285 [Acholeplasmatales bacterium]|nr:hypothetical protein [Acholeplasmatales bacterium]
MEINNIEKSHELYYTDINLNKLKEHKIRYLIYGITLLVFSIIMFILEYGQDGITTVLDSILSFAMFASMALAILYIIRALTLKNSIKSDSAVINMANYSFKVDEDGNITYNKTFSFLRFYGIFVTILNLSLPIAYFAGMANSSYYSVDINAKWILATIVAVIMVSIPFFSIIALPNEKELYNGFELRKKDNS